jgi:hypothetical protein
MLWPAPTVPNPPTALRVSRILNGGSDAYCPGKADVTPNWSAAEVALVAAVVTVMSTLDAACTGLTAVIWVSETTVKLAAGADPKVTAVAPRKPAPVMVTLVPARPEVGAIVVTAGGTQ